MIPLDESSSFSPCFSPSFVPSATTTTTNGETMYSTDSAASCGSFSSSSSVSSGSDVDSSKGCCGQAAGTAQGRLHNRFAGRTAAGTEQPITLAKNGQRHLRYQPLTGNREEILSVGLACSECFSGPRLADILRPGLEYERRVMDDLISGLYAAPLSIHTSSGVPAALDDFIEALEKHLPWKFCKKEQEDDGDDWLVSLQIEGASAVWAAVDMLLQVDILTTGNKNRKMVAVGSRSYHGPPVTSFGGRSPLWNKSYQVKYPVPVVGEPIDSGQLLADFASFLERHGHDVGVILIEPQWGSSQVAMPWPRDLLLKYVCMARSYGIKVLCDEIMCGLGRHGHGTLFLSDAWGLDPDAITFGKAIAGGVYPMSGAVLKKGRKVLGSHGRSVMQSHTFSGSSVRALMTGTAVLNALPHWFSSIAKLGKEMGYIFRYLEVISDGMVVARGQGLMWGCMFASAGENVDESKRAETVACFKRHCDEIGIVPYYVPVGGFMVTPVVDIDVGTIYEIGTKLEQAIRRTMNERGWSRAADIDAVAADVAGDVDVVDGAERTSKRISASDTMFEINKAGTCSTQFHVTRSCTSCANFVCRDVRMRFLHI